jgi:glycosyltransferase involved in cell wall biosynthesis
MKQGYIPKEERKKILLLCDDIRMHSGIATMAREIVVGTSHRFNWINVAAGINHPEHGKKLDLSGDTGKHNGIEDASVILYPHNGYGSPESIRQLISIEKPDVIMIFTDPRYWIWLFQIENEIRKRIPLIYLNIWDDYPAPLYNEPFYESCDALMAISKQTLNINRIVLGDKAKDKVLRYVPHGINENHFFPIDSSMEKESIELSKFKLNLLEGRNYNFVFLYNARNIRRKCVSDLIAAYSIFCDKIGKEKAKKSLLLLHTQAVDENGTDLPEVIDLLCDPEYVNVKISEHRFGAEDMNRLYNISDVVVLPSSNEGWGLSLTEGMMAGKPIIATVTGGMQDQMRFVNEKGEWIDFDENFCSNHFGTYRNSGKWAFPVFPSNTSMVGSVPTPYIFDDRADFRDIAVKLQEVHSLKESDPKYLELIGQKAREWVTSDEAMMTSANMCKNVISTVEDTLETFKPRKRFELLKIEDKKRRALRHKLIY